MPTCNWLFISSDLVRPGARALYGWYLTSSYSLDIPTSSNHGHVEKALVIPQGVSQVDLCLVHLLTIGGDANCANDHLIPREDNLIQKVNIGQLVEGSGTRPSDYEAIEPG